MHAAGSRWLLRRGGVAGWLGACLWAGSVLAGAYDPLTQAELDRAVQLAQADQRFKTLQARASRLELLFVERHEEGKSQTAGDERPARRADVFAYLYGQEQTLHAVVDLNRGRVDQLSAQAGVQPPLNPAESRRALDLALADPQAGKVIRDEYRAAAGRALQSAADLRWRALIFYADAHPAAAEGEASACGAERCAQLLLTTRDNTVVNVMPLVNLSRNAAVASAPFVEN